MFLPPKVSVVTYGCESWTIKKAECRRIDAFELQCWKRLLRVLWTARRSNQSILNEINPEYSLQGLRFKLKLQYFGHLMWRTDSLEKTVMLGWRRRGWQRMRWLDGIIKSMDMSLSKVWKLVKDREVCVLGPWGRKELHTTEWLNWTPKSYSFEWNVTHNCYIIQEKGYLDLQTATSQRATILTIKNK